MIYRQKHSHVQPREIKETITFRDDDPSNPKNFIHINIRNDGEIVLTLNPSRHLAHASKSVQKNLQPWLCNKFGGQPNQRRWRLTEQQLRGLLLESAN